ncbi:MAG: sodium:solute symporter family protein, partial [Candidatus Hatepunaea meridiana]|nr:sodium:solute symporter family protein [Candidatus Hatepunaea meridiana]
REGGNPGETISCLDSRLRGNDKKGTFRSGTTYGTAYFSAVLFIGFAGKIGWSFGYSGLWIAVGNALIGVLGVWWLLGPRIKRMSVEYKVHTMPEYFEKRYNSPFLKLFASVSIFIFFIPYSAAVFMGLSYLFKATFNIDYTYALLFMGLFTALYIVLGGYKSMTMIDLVFGMIMSVGVVILLWSVIDKGDGLANITSTLTAINPKLTQVIGPPGWWPLFSLIFLTSIAPFAMPQLVQKFYAIKDERSIKIGMIASTFFAFLIGGIGYFTGATTRFFLSPDNAPNAFENGKPVFDALMPELLVNIIPEALAVLILLLILSASMSTLAALVLISSSSISKDVYAGFINRDVSDKHLTMLMRFSSVFFVALSVILAFFKPATIVAILGISWGAIGAVFLGPFIWGLFCKRVNKFGAVSSSILGLTVCLYLYFTGIPSPQAGTIGMMVSLGVNPVFSLLRFAR